MHLFSPAPWIVLLLTLLVSAADPRAAATVDAPKRAIPVPSPGDATVLEAYRQPGQIPFPADAPYTPAMGRLGRILFFDARLSASGTISCGSCHNPAFSWSSGSAQLFTADGVKWPRHTPTIANLAWRDTFMLDGRFTDLSDQVYEAMENPATMGRPRTQLAGLFDQSTNYQALLAAAAPGELLTADLVARAIATYERSLVYAPSPFDAWANGDAHAVSDAARRGFAVFTGRGGCVACHSGWNFSDDGFHDIGLPDDDLGRGALMPKIVKLQHAFRTPGLRDIGRRSPYMHNGSLATLQDVVEHYDQGGVDRPSRSELVHPIGLSASEKADLVEFLRSLTAGGDFAGTGANDQ
jgi:cytochrome c peroxidase